MTVGVIVAEALKLFLLQGRMLSTVDRSGFSHSLCACVSELSFRLVHQCGMDQPYDVPPVSGAQNPSVLAHG